jgi:CHAT domain-containing protein
LAEEYPKKIWTLNGDYVNPLPGTATEVKKILNKFTENQKQAVVKINTSATERYFKNTDLDQFNIIHLATHGFVNSENPDKSGILFADPDDSPEDGILHTNEIYNLSLNTDLVNLSACETGLGKMAKGEGIVGLTRAMLYAGTQNLIVSLWQVYDLSTRNLMIDFYEHQIEQSHNQYFSPSLRKAKLNMIKEGEYAHPFYWAAFILIGE